MSPRHDFNSQSLAQVRRATVSCMSLCLTSLTHLSSFSLKSTNISTTPKTMSHALLLTDAENNDGFARRYASV